jgi:hypothetical protein
MGNPLLFVGQTVKSLKAIINFFGNSEIHSGPTDPSMTALSAPAGSLKLDSSNGNTYQKQDSGLSTNWSIVVTGTSNNINGGVPSTNFLFTKNVTGGTP